MIRNRRTAAMAGLTAWAMMLTAARADTASLIEQVPGEAALAVIVPNWQKLGERVAAYGKAFGAPAEAPGMGGDLTPMLAEAGWNLDQLDMTGSVGLVIMDFKAVAGDSDKPAGVFLLLPVKDYDAFLKANQGRQEGALTVIGPAEADARGRSYVVKAGQYAKLIPNEQTAKAADTGKPLSATIAKTSKDLLGRSDLFLHLDAAQGVEGFKMLLADSRTLPKSQATAMLNLLKVVLDDAQSVDSGVTLGDNNIELAMEIATKDGSAMAKAFAGMKTARGGLIFGIPDDTWLLAGGGLPGGQAVREWQRKTAEHAAKTAGTDPDKVRRALDRSARLEELVTRSSFALTATKMNQKLLPPVAITVVYETNNAAEARKLIEEGVAEFEMPAGQPPQAPAAEGQPPAQPAAIRIFAPAQAETVGDMQFSRFDLSEAVLQAAGPAAAIVGMAVGAQPAVRITTAGDKVVCCFSGDMGGLQAAVTAAKAGKPLNGGLAKVQEHMQPARSAEAYISGARIVMTVANFVTRMNPNANLPEFADTAGPVAMSIAGGNSTLHCQLIVPKALVVNAIDYVGKAKAAMAPQQQPGGGQPLPPGEDF